MEEEDVVTTFFPPEPRIKYVDSGLGVYLADKNMIYLNKCLRNDKIMHDKVLAHERFHTHSTDMLTDVLYDLKPDISLFWYSLNHPSTWTSFLPIQKVDKFTIVNPINTMLYITLTIIIGGLKWITY